MGWTWIRAIASAALCVGAATGHAAAQPVCQQWREGGSIPGVNSAVNVVAPWDEDGSGPRLPAVVVGGSFSGAGATLASLIALWDTGTWRALAPLGQGAFGEQVTSVAVYANQLVVAGNFTQASGAPAGYIARLGPSGWTPLAGGVSGPVARLIVWGNLLVAEHDVSPASQSRVVSVWDGAAWAPVSTLNAPGGAPVGPLAVLNNELIAVGGFTSDTTRIYALRPGGWEALTAGPPSGAVLCAHVSGTTLYVGGQFEFAGSTQVNNIARWNGQAWSGLASPSGTVGVAASAGNAQVRSITTLGERLIVGGTFNSAGGAPASNIAAWAPSGWSPLNDSGGQGVDAAVWTVSAIDARHVVAAGVFRRAGGVAVNQIARFTLSAAATDPAVPIAGTWGPLLSERGNVGPNNSVAALTTFNGRLIAGGYYLRADDLDVNNIAAWDGVRWSTLQTAGQRPGVSEWNRPGESPGVNAVGVFAGELIAGGQFLRAGDQAVRHVARWDGVQWRSLAGTTGEGTDGPVIALGTFGTRLILAGQFAEAGGAACAGIAAWDGATFAPLGTGLHGITSNVPPTTYALTNYAGELIAGGNIRAGASAQYLARWNGIEWRPLADSVTGGTINWTVRSMAVFNGSLYVGGPFCCTGNQVVNGIARWDGSRWNPAPGLGPIGLGEGGQSLAMTTTVGGVGGSRLIVAGRFTLPGATGGGAINIAQYDGFAWAPLGTGINAPVDALGVFDPAGLTPELVVAGGSFSTAGGRFSPNFAVWGPPSRSVWAVPGGGGNAGLAENWACGATPAADQIVVFDEVEAGVPQGPTYQVNLAAPLVARRLISNTDQVTINLGGNAVTLTGGSSASQPPVGVGARANAANVEPRLLLRNPTGNDPATFTASSLSVGLEPGIIASAPSEFSVRDAGLTAVINGSVEVGVRSPGLLQVRDGARLRYGFEEDSYLGVGLFPSAGTAAGGEIRITGGGVLESPVSTRVLSVGSTPGADARVVISGAGSLWRARQQDLLIGDLGAAGITVSAGGQLVSTTGNRVVLGRTASGAAQVTIGPGGTWNETLSAIDVGLSDAGSALVAVQSQGTIAAPALNVLQRGVLTGTGLVQADVFNFGVVRPGSPTGVLTVQGDYRQIPPSPTDPRSGRLEVELSDVTPNTGGRLAVSGPAELGGALIARFPPGYLPTANQPINTEVLTALSITRAFDVAYFPALAPGDVRSLRTQYNRAGSVVVTTGSLGGAVDLTSPAATPLAGVPTAWAKGDVNADGKTDVAVAVSAGVAQPGSVFILLNASTAPGQIAFVPGPTQQITVGREPRGLAIGDIDGDSRADLIVSSSLDNDVRVFLQSASGGGVFLGGAVVVPVGRRPAGLCLADLARTGRLDIAAAATDDHALEVLLNTSTPGTVQLARQVPLSVRGSQSGGPRGPTRVVSFNPDQDKDLDLAIINPGASTVTVLQSTALPGVFSTGVRLELPVGAGPADIAAAPLGASTGEDLVVANAAGSSVSVVLFDRGQAGFAFRPAANLDLGIAPVGVITADLDNAPGFAGLRDVDVALLGTAPNGAASVRVLRNDFDGTVGQATLAVQPEDPTLTAGTAPYALVGDNVRTAASLGPGGYGSDLDTDGRKDLLVLTNLAPSPILGVPFSDRGPGPVLRGVRSRGACPADINTDGALSVQDIFDFLTAWFSGCVVPGGPSCPRSADFDASGSVTIQDLFDYLTAFFRGC